MILAAQNMLSSIPKVIGIFLIESHAINHCFKMFYFYFMSVFIYIEVGRKGEMMTDSPCACSTLIG